MSSLAEVYLDEIDVTDLALEGTVTHRLNRPWTATIRLPAQDKIGGVNSLLKVYFDGILQFHGKVLQTETTVDENTGYTVYNATDPLELWQWRPVRDPPDTSGKYGDPGNFSKPSIIEDFVTGPAIVNAMMNGSELNSIPADSEGPLRLQRGTVAGGGADLTGAPADWPMTMADLATILTSTGEVDIVVTPIELDGFDNYGRIDLYNGNFGTDRTATVIFEHGAGARNIRSFRWTENMTNMVNKLWYYLGPKIDDEHWQANITASDPLLPDPPETTVESVMNASRALYDVRMQVQIHDSTQAEALVAHNLYRRLWQMELYLRAQPLSMIHITPTRDTAIDAFEVGDLITVQIEGEIGSGLVGAQRIYEFSVSWDAPDSVLALSELQTSPTGEGFA